MTADAIRTGGCLCGAVRYAAPATPAAVVACHCRDYQKQSGSAFSIIAVFPRDSVRFTGAPATFLGRGDSGAAVERNFCAQCGSPLFSDSDAMRARGIIAIKAGTLDDVSDLSPRLHYWARSMQPWVPLPGDAVCRDKD